MTLPEVTGLESSPEMASVWITLTVSLVLNGGTFLTLVAMAGKFIWSWSKLDSKTNQNSKDINAAFVKIRDIENKIYNNRTQ